MRILPYIIGVGVILGGCTVGPDFQSPRNTAESFEWSVRRSKEAYSKVVEDPVQSDWWRVFDDPTLSRLQERVVHSNLDVRVAMARLKQSRALRQSISSDALPSIDMKGSYKRQRNTEEGMFDASGYGGRKNFNHSLVGFDATWELDLWGRVRRELEAADATVSVSESQLRGVLVSVQAELAINYIRLRYEQQLETIIRQNIEVAEKNLNLTYQRFDSGVATELDMAEAMAHISETEARLPDTEKRQTSFINALSFLLGEKPQSLRAELKQPVAVPMPSDIVPIGLASEIVRRRPDILQAEAQLHAATANIGVATADFYPHVTLNGSFGLESLQLSNLGDWSSRNFSIGPSVSLPIFEGGRLKGILALREAQQQEAAITYRRTVLKAWEEVDNNLFSYQSEQRRNLRLNQALLQNKRALKNAERQYKAGAINFLDVLYMQRKLLSTQEMLVRSREETSITLIALYKALGGGWKKT
ncbi:efflux transporter outer membrane subunit [Pseudomonas aeruginosa]|uniref:efflux transporter outer membrane subunit n=1 Tax=Pseudomonas aeruginosa TaxID=287 RepID=UPI0009A2BD1B|nr:efflux transporter outer membrane subunit [Pseudomonas aeruginosa]WNP71126.1 efflux transporter outer membrane subunit [Pseudomonas aeruginosa]HBN9524567.1 efflux transporter outer membrane subunit [Pseudomonas aeruginosa]HBP1137356.1 efflux transporter outer membrane subunit [Pseudomonas aeruginosa]